MKTLQLLSQSIEHQIKGLNIPAEKKYAHVSDRLHAASMLALVQASYSVLHTTTMPTPLYRLVYDDENRNIDFKLLQGNARVPSEHSLDIDMFQIIAASLLRDKMPLLFEGKTGVGKTHTSEFLFKTILPPENYSMLRLNANMSHVLQPYMEGYVESGVVKIRLRTQKLREVAAIFIDEVNRGDTNQILGLQDGTITLSSGERGELGIPIPNYARGEWVESEEKRPVFVLSAQNPPATKDAKYSHTRRSDAAQANRNLEIDIPNSVTSIGASILLLDSLSDLHGPFRREYAQLMAKYVGVASEKIENMDDWLSVYAFTTDPKKTDCISMRSSVEFIDAMLCMTSPNISNVFAEDKQVVADWHTYLQDYGVDFSYASSFVEDTEEIKKITAIVNSFKEEIIPRDVVKVKKISDAISTIWRIRKSLDAADPVSKYLDMPRYITVQDVACGFAIMLHDKQETHEKDTASLVSGVLKEYAGITEEVANALTYNYPFSAQDPRMSVYGLAFNHAISTTDNKKLLGGINYTGQEQIPLFMHSLGVSVGKLRQLDAKSEIRKPLVARMIGDLTTLAAFTHQYRADLEKIFQNGGRKMDEFKKFYIGRRGNLNTPEIYTHRLTRVLGV
jgi:hypothetical protein